MNRKGKLLRTNFFVHCNCFVVSDFIIKKIFYSKKNSSISKYSEIGVGITRYVVVEEAHRFPITNYGYRVEHYNDNEFAFKITLNRTMLKKTFP